MNKAIINFIDKRFYSQFPVNWDNKLFRKKILAVIKPQDVMLDLGAGSGYVKEMNFKNEVREVTGIDMDPDISKNPFLHQYVFGSVYDLSDFEKEKFDVIICNSVIEHIENPEKFVSELSRVLKPGGYFLAKTPNRNNYMPLAARLTPLSFHKWYNKKRGRPEEHTFPTYYRLNTSRAVKKYFSVNVFESVRIETFEGPPSYLRFNFIFYLIGWIYERMVTIFNLDSFKMVMIFSAKKKN
ncbi:MAG: class I SAM-dependent methyltransferase [Bacteroidota bacterium]